MTFSASGNRCTASAGGVKKCDSHAREGKSYNPPDQTESTENVLYTASTAKPPPEECNKAASKVQQLQRLRRFYKD